MNRIDREKQVVRKMIAIYCEKHHRTHNQELCPQCEELAQYATLRLSRCPFGETKGACADCQIHCYTPAQREQIRVVMRYSGPRMLWHSPLVAIRHLLSKLRKPNTKRTEIR